MLILVVFWIPCTLANHVVEVESTMFILRPSTLNKTSGLCVKFLVNGHDTDDALCVQFIEGSLLTITSRVGKTYIETFCLITAVVFVSPLSIVSIASSLISA